ncbi:MAG: hypothetical protein N2316_08530 [Spirochaetes bacterium]|nr:hypothetical protein [Spirochaetota bacterium]
MKNRIENGFTYSSATYSDLRIYKRLKDKKEALAIQKHSIAPLEGKIEKIIYDYSTDELDIYLQ